MHSSEDERVLYAQITDEGMALRERALSIPGKMGECIRLSREDALELYRLLNLVLSKL